MTSFGYNVLGFGSAIAMRPPATVTFTARTHSSANATAYTFSGVAISTAAASRRIAVIAGASHSSSAANYISTLTVAGVSASMQVRATQGSQSRNEIWIADVPTGTSGDIVVTFGGGMPMCGIGVFAIYNTAGDATDTGAGTFTASLDCKKDGVVIAGIVTGSNAASSSPFSWANITERYDSTTENPSAMSGASDAFDSAQTGLACACTAQASTADSAINVAAAFR